jgi:circadian clock protein KaiC
MAAQVGLEKLSTGIEGFDFIAKSGIPKQRTTLIAGAAGTGKSVFAGQFLVSGIEKFNEHGVFVSFEENPGDIRMNFRGFIWNISDYETKNQWRFVDASPDMDSYNISTGSYDLNGLIAQIRFAVKAIEAKRVVLDSISAIFSQFSDTSQIRRELQRLLFELKRLGVTCIMTAEQVEEITDNMRFGVETFVSDNVVIFRNVKDREMRRRTVEILKFRGAAHAKGEYPFTIIAEKGLEVLPISTISMNQKVSQERISTGNPDLDEMCGGGFFKNSTILLSGATGTGKSLLGCHFVDAAIQANERAIYFAFEEGAEQILRNTKNWNIGFSDAVKKKKLFIISDYPEKRVIEDHLIRIKDKILELKPKRVVLDSFSALGRICSEKALREFIISLTAFLKTTDATTLFTYTSIQKELDANIIKENVLTITDTILSLQYESRQGEFERSIFVLKMRGSKHSNQSRQFIIDDKGFHLGEVSGLDVPVSKFGNE